jgi:hypothetical protein
LKIHAFFGFFKGFLEDLAHFPGESKILRENSREGDGIWYNIVC